MAPTYAQIGAFPRLRRVYGGANAVAKRVPAKKGNVKRDVRELSMYEEDIEELCGHRSEEPSEVYYRDENLIY